MPNNMPIFRLLRLLRLTRMAKHMKAMPELLTLIKGTVAATRSVGSPLVLLIVFLYVFEVGWNTWSRFANAQVQIMGTMIPMWNSFAKYAVEPAIYIALDTISLVFTGEEYRGLITEDQVPYAGYICDANDRNSMAWCGSFEFYKTAL